MEYDRGRGRRALLSGFIFLVLLSNAYAGEVVDRIVAVVNDDIITLSELNGELRPYAEKIDKLGYSLEQERAMLFKARGEVLEQLIEKKLTAQEVKRLKIEVGEAELDNTIENIKKSNYFTDEDLRKGLAAQGLTLEEYRERLRSQIQRNRLVNAEVKSKIVITADEVRAYYDNHLEKYKGEKKYHLRNIIMMVQAYASESSKLAIRKKMKAVREKFDAGESFESLARQYSEAPFASDGGDLGVFKLEELSPEIRAAVENLAAGECTDVMDTSQGWQIFFVEEIIVLPTRSLSDAEAEIEEFLFNEIIDKRFGEWIKGLRERSHIKVIQ
ncbi:MAG: hypothetical protein GY859_03795 [Desulfobacterales bacterium]|nr:hypothetical protein [Desulfobacterales bacterium]